MHYANALWSIWLRRSLSLSRWEWWQLGLGLCIPALLVHHVTSVRIAIGVAGFEGTYDSVLALQWLVLPWLAVVQAAAVIVVWAHAMIGLHFWLRTKPSYPQWRGALAIAGLLLPTLALSGYVAAGNQVLRAAGAQVAEQHDRRDDRAGQPHRGDRLVAASRAGAAAVRGARRAPHGRAAQPPSAAHAFGRTHGSDAPRRDRAGDAARARHPARRGVRRPRALHHLPRAGHQGPRCAARAGSARGEGADAHRRDAGHAACLPDQADRRHRGDAAARRGCERRGRNGARRTGGPRAADHRGVRRPARLDRARGSASCPTTCCSCSTSSSTR